MSLMHLSPRASSGDIFENFLKQGMGARPIIVGYENQMIEFLVENAQYADLIRQKIRTIYPEPTIFASHPLISLKPECKRLVEALQDPEVQHIARRDHGFPHRAAGDRERPRRHRDRLAAREYRPRRTDAALRRRDPDHRKRAVRRRRAANLNAARRRRRRAV